MRGCGQPLRKETAPGCVHCRHGSEVKAAVVQPLCRRKDRSKIGFGSLALEDHVEPVGTASQGFRVVMMMDIVRGGNRRYKSIDAFNDDIVSV
jgi:hypothetical protein